MLFGENRGHNDHQDALRPIPRSLHEHGRLIEAARLLNGGLGSSRDVRRLLGLAVEKLHLQEWPSASLDRPARYESDQTPE
jgi:hypothetical protein